MMEKLMNLTTRLAASAMSFAHLGSVGRGKSARADDKDKDYKDDKDDDKDAKKADDQGDTGDDDASAKADDPSAEDDDDENEKQKSPEGKKGKKASSEDDDDENEKQKSPEGKKGKASAKDEDEDDDDEMHGKSAIARARLREQARCAAIMGCRAAGRNVPLAAQLALATRMTREEAIAVLENTPAANADASLSRAARNPQLGSGGHVAADSPAALQASWDRAFEKAGAVRRK
jgi:hypothetical protein